MAYAAAAKLAPPRLSVVSERQRQLLSQRERQIVQLLARGLSSKQIGGALEISTSTVNQHIRNLLLKLRAANRTHAVAIAVRQDLVHDQS